MDTSIFLAKAFSIYFLIMGITIIFRRKKLMEAVDALFANAGNIFFMAIIVLILGIILVLFHPAFTPDWRSVITVLCWLTLLKGIVYILVPEFIMLTKQKMFASAAYFYIGGIICLALALYLGYYGFGW